MAIPRNLGNLASGADTNGVLGVTKGGTGAATLTANNVLLGNGTSAVQAVAPGTNGNVLTSNGTTWSSSTPSTPTAVANLSGGSAGVIPFQSGTNTTSFTAVGTAGQILTSAGAGTPTWTTPSAGAMTLIATRTITSNTASAEWTGLSGYSSYFLIFRNVRPRNSGYLRLLLGTGSTTYLTSNYINNLIRGTSGGSATNAISTPQSYFSSYFFNSLPVVAGDDGSGGFGGVSGNLYLNNFNNAISNYTFINGQIAYDAAYTAIQEINGGYIQNTTPKTAIKIEYNTGDINSGTLSLYGISS